jgi:hypothetical protein
MVISPVTFPDVPGGVDDLAPATDERLEDLNVRHTTEATAHT